MSKRRKGASPIHKQAEQAGMTASEYAAHIVRQAGNSIERAARRTDIPVTTVKRYLQLGGWQVANRSELVPLEKTS